MIAERLIALYERVAEAPDAVVRLRQLILDLAVRGKLVLQDLSEGSGAELRAQIAIEKAKMVKARLIRAGQTSSDISAGNLPALPPSWAWTTLGAIGDWGAGSTPSRSESGAYGGGYTWLKSGELGDRIGLVGSEETLTKEAIANGSFRINRPGDVLIAMYGATIGKLAILGEEAVTNQAVCGCTPFPGVFNRYLFYFLLAQRSAFHAASEGGAQPNISKVKIVSTPFPLPPTAEQRRIVAKVDELMALLDRLEAARHAREATRDRLAAATLARLTAPDASAEDATNNARFALQTLPALTTRPDQIKALRQTILNLAVRGRLVEQEPADEPASSELSKALKLKLEHDLYRPKKVAAIADSEKWCTTPKGWCWTRWDQITNWITYGFTRPMEHVEKGVPIVTGKNVNEGRIILETASLTPQSAFDALNEKDKPQPGDILITKDGSIGRVAIVSDVHLPFCINQSVAVMWLRSCHFDRKYLKLVLESPQTQDVLQEKTAGVAIKHISITDLGKMVFPLPPLSEQHRIVAKVEALMALCDQLEAALTTTNTTRTRLLEALLHEALAPAELEKAA